MSTAEKAERAAFEAWVEGEGFFANGEYSEAQDRYMWIAWQARGRASSSTPEGWRRERIESLVQRLRDYYTEDEVRFHIDHPICDEAADLIEALAPPTETP